MQKKLHLSSRQLFLIDGIGAVVSAIMLGVVLVGWNHWVGMPVQALYVLAAIPIGFAAYDFYCYLRVAEPQSNFLKVIAGLNLAYCGISIAFLFQHWSSLTWLGWAYFLIELVIVIVLASIQLRASRA